MPHWRITRDAELDPIALDALQDRFVRLNPMALLRKSHVHQQRLLALRVQAGHCDVHKQSTEDAQGSGSRPMSGVRILPTGGAIDKLAQNWHGESTQVQEV